MASPARALAITCRISSGHDSDADPTIASGPEAAAAGATGTLPPQERIGGRFEILALLGAGGMGNVYRARDLELGEDVALKMLKPDLVRDSRALERFRQEV